MKHTLPFIILALVYLTGCTKQMPERASSTTTDSTFVPPDLGDDEVEVKEDHPRYLSRGQAEPNFWDPTYRSRKVMNVYIELDYSLTTAWGVNADANLQRLCNSSSQILERIAGPKINLVKVKKWTTPDPYAIYPDAMSVLYNWGNANPLKKDTFNVFISGKNFGGIAYISRENVTSVKYSVCGFGQSIPGDAFNYTYSVYCFTHELLHNLGISHTQNCCAWKSQTGVSLGRLDSCYSAEITCSPTPTNCSSTTKRMAGGLNSYCHLYNTMQYTLHPAVVPVLHKSLFYSNLPDYSTNPPPPPPTGTNTFRIAGTPYQPGYTRADTAKAVDGNEATRWLTAGPTTLTWTFAQPVTRTQVYLSSGYNGGSPNQTLTLTVDGVNVPLGFDKKIKFTKAINVSGKRFVLTTTGTGNISRIFEISLK
jgi:hypothetical protein